jgi:hypothetical protein
MSSTGEQPTPTRADRAVIDEKFEKNVDTCPVDRSERRRLPTRAAQPRRNPSATQNNPEPLHQRRNAPPKFGGAFCVLRCCGYSYFLELRRAAVRHTVGMMAAASSAFTTPPMMNGYRPA